MIEIEALSKTYGGGDVKAVDGIGFKVETGSLFTLLGPSGCGKTTTLRCVAGLEKPDSGEIRLFGEHVYSSKSNVFVAPSRRNIGMVFQSYAIWPHMTVFQNVAYPLKGKGWSRKEMRTRALDALKVVDLEGYEDRPAPKLSGGQQQRVALARAMASDPKVFLFDEPLSNLDAKLREEMRGQIRQLQRKLGITSLYVTHDQVEALSISDQIAIMDGGRIIEVGRPRDIYLHPHSKFAAQFVGLTNILPASLKGADDRVGLRLEVPFGELVCTQAETNRPPPDSRVMVLIRPENLRLSIDRMENQPNVWPGKVISSTFLGEFLDVAVSCSGTSLRARISPFSQIHDGADVFLHVAPEQFSVISG
jgi:iron(III) transport system ATP-binding protein